MDIVLSKNGVKCAVFKISNVEIRLHFQVDFYTNHSEILNKWFINRDIHIKTNKLPLYVCFVHQ